jgi:hypothetical protein
MGKMKTYRIENIQKIRLNGKNVKVFKAYKKSANAYVFIGQFIANAQTSNKNLVNFIVEGEQRKL